MKISTTLLALLLSSSALLAGCPAKQPVAPPPTTEEPPPAGDPLLTADGHHFAASRTYQGECMPAGTRGGCYSITLEPDGQYRQVLLDAAIIGSYSIDGDQVQLTPSGDAEPQTMTLSADRTQLGDHQYLPAKAP